MSNLYGKTILIAEDHKDLRLMLRFFLQDKGYRVIEAENGEQAVNIAQSKNPDLILMDLNMPLLDGVAAAKQIRQNAESRDIPIITNSGSGECGIDFFLNISNFGKGFISYLTKPLNLNELCEQIESALNRESRKAT